MLNAYTEEAQALIQEGLLALNRASQYGMKMDLDYCKSIKKVLEKKIKKKKADFLETEVGKIWRTKAYPVNINSDIQLKKVLFEELGIESIKKTAKKKPSLDSETLEIYAKKNPELLLINEIRKLEKVHGTYISGFMKEQVDGIIHPFFHLHKTKTFRSSSSDPNFQNIPKRDIKQKRLCRKAFIPRKGRQIMAADFSGVEVCISGCYNQDPNLLTYIKDPTTDMHGDMAQQIFFLKNFKKAGTEKVLRNGAKNGFVFPQFYGDYYGNNALGLCTWAHLPQKGKFKKDQGLLLSSGITVGEHLINNNIKSFDRFLDHLQKIEEDFWGRRFKVYAKWKETMIADYYKKGYLHTYTGFTCQGLMGPNDITNYPIQGSAFHCLLKSFIEVERRLNKYNLKTKLIGQIHDEMVLELVPEEQTQVVDILKDVTQQWLAKQWKWIIVPLKIEIDLHPIDGSWAEKAETVN